MPWDNSNGIFWRTSTTGDAADDLSTNFQTIAPIVGGYFDTQDVGIGFDPASALARLAIQDDNQPGRPVLHLARNKDGARIHWTYSANTAKGEIGETYGGGCDTWIGANLDSTGAGHVSVPTQGDGASPSWVIHLNARASKDYCTIGRIAAAGVSTETVFLKIDANGFITLRNEVGGIRGALWTSGGDNASVTNSTSETTLLATGDGSKTIALADQRVGRVFTLRAQGTINTVNPAGNITFRIKWGTLSTDTITLSAADALVNEEWELEARCALSANKPTALSFSRLIYSDSNSWKGGGVGGKSFSQSPAADLGTVNLTVQFATADAGNTIACGVATLEFTY